MDKKFHFRREVEVDNIFEKRDVDTSGCQVGDNQEPDLLLSELEKALLTCSLVHRSVNEH